MQSRFLSLLLLAERVFVCACELTEEMDEKYKVAAEVSPHHAARFLEYAVEPFDGEFAVYGRGAFDVSRFKVNGGAQRHPQFDARHRILVSEYPFFLFWRSYAD